MEAMFDEMDQLIGIIDGFGRRADGQADILVETGKGDIETTARGHNGQSLESDHRHSAQVQLFLGADHIGDQYVGAGDFLEGRRKVRNGGTAENQHRIELAHGVGQPGALFLHPGDGFVNLLEAFAYTCVRLPHGNQFCADLVAGGAVVLGAQGHCHQADQWLVNAGIVVLQVVVQGIIDHGGDHVVHRGL